MPARAPSWGVLAAAFIVIWVPYVSAVGLQERLGGGGAAGPALMLLSLVIAFSVSWWLARRIGPNPFGLHFDKAVAPTVLLAMVVMVAARLLAAVVSVAGGFGSYASSDSLTQLAASFGLALLIGAVPALAEDILTRGFPLFAARSTKPAWLLILLSAAMYTANHIWRFDWGLSEQLRLFCMGMAYAVAAWRMGSLWAAFGLHLGWNAGAALVPLDIADVATFRMETAAIHLLLAAFFMLVPGKVAQPG